MCIILRFYVRRQMAPQQSAEFRTANFRQFCSTLRKDSVADYGWIWTQFLSAVGGLGVIYKHKSFRSSIGRYRHNICKFEVEILQNVMNNVCLFVCLSRCGSPARCLFEGTYFGQVLCHGFRVDCDFVFTRFSEVLGISCLRR